MTTKISVSWTREPVKVAGTYAWRADESGKPSVQYLSLLNDWIGERSTEPLEFVEPDPLAPLSDSERWNSVFTRRWYEETVLKLEAEVASRTAERDYVVKSNEALSDA